MKPQSAEYHRLHWWLRKYHEKPIACDSCGATKRLDWANISGEYLHDILDYRALCRQCHKIYDRQNVCKRGHFRTVDNTYKHPNRGNMCKECKRQSRRKYYLTKGK